MAELIGTSKRETGIAYIVDDDELIRETLETLFEASGYEFRSFVDGVDFLAHLDVLTPGVVLLDVRLPKVDGIQVLKSMLQHNADWPVIVMSGQADVAMAVEAMRSGARNFIEKPFSVGTVLKAVEETVAQVGTGERTPARVGSKPLEEVLTEREMQVLRGLVQGRQNKVIAKDLEISHRTVEVHRANIMRRLNAGSFAEVVRIAVLSGLVDE